MHPRGGQIKHRGRCLIRGGRQLVSSLMRRMAVVVRDVAQGGEQVSFVVGEGPVEALAAEGAYPVGFQNCRHVVWPAGLGCALVLVVEASEERSAFGPLLGQVHHGAAGTWAAEAPGHDGASTPT